MNEKVDIRVQVDPTRQDPRVIIQTPEKSDLVENIIYAIERCVDTEFPQVAVYEGESVVMLNQWDIVRVYSENRKLAVITEEADYESRATLKELEEVLDKDCFVRISRFEIINLRKVHSFDFGTTGTINVIFEDGSETWVARRYVREIRETLSRRQG